MENRENDGKQMQCRQKKKAKRRISMFHAVCVYNRAAQMGMRAWAQVGIRSGKKRRTKSHNENIIVTIKPDRNRVHYMSVCMQGNRVERRGSGRGSGIFIQLYFLLFFSVRARPQTAHGSLSNFAGTVLGLTLGHSHQLMCDHVVHVVDIPYGR